MVSVDPISAMIAGLVAEQTRDETSRRVDPEPGISAATDLGLDLAIFHGRDMTIGPRRRRPRRWVRVSWKAIAPEGTEQWIVIRGLNPWSARDFPDSAAASIRCPVCGGRPLREAVYCARCDRCGADGRAEFPGVRPGEAERDDCPREYLNRPAYSAPRRGGLSLRIRLRRRKPA